MIKKIEGNFLKSLNKPDDETLKPLFTIIGKKMRITTVTVTIQYFLVILIIGINQEKKSSK